VKTEFCKLEESDRILTVRINRPERLNALHSPANIELGLVFDHFSEDDGLGVAIITGEGQAFCAGNDLRYQASGGSFPPMPRGFGGLTSRWDLLKPVIAAVNGAAMGGGFEIALACDLIIAADRAVFALPEPRVGLAATAGGLVRLPREIGSKRALHMILTGRKVSAEEGKELGFVNEVTPLGELMPRAISLAREILECSPMSLRASKDVVRRSLDMASVRESVEADYPSLRALASSEDFIEGPRAFSEKRRPNWTGR
jgi:enoyl-CoA hydratase/carnithine racemase